MKNSGLKIERIEYFRLQLAMDQGYTIAYESVNQAENLILQIHISDGLTGWGCAAPDEVVTSESPDQVVANIENFVIPLLRGGDPFRILYYHEQLKAQNPSMASTLAMVNMALLDLLARRAELPLYQLLGGYRQKIQTSITLGIMPLAETLEVARDYWRQGFQVLKLKGGKELEADIEKTFKLRERFGANLQLRFDANQGYTATQAIRFVEETRSVGIEILEQPTAFGDDEALSMVTNEVAIPTMADESIRTLKDAFRLSKGKVTNMINIKIMKVGGITEAQHINSVAKAAGLDIMVGCLDECALGISAGLHFALSRPNVEYADLDGHLDFTNDPFQGLFSIQGGYLFPSFAPGLGKIKI